MRNRRTAIDKVLTDPGYLAKFFSSNQRFKFPMLDKLCKEFLHHAGQDMFHLPDSQIESTIHTMMLEMCACGVAVSEFMKHVSGMCTICFFFDPTYSLSTNCCIISFKKYSRNIQTYYQSGRCFRRAITISCCFGHYDDISSRSSYSQCC